MVERIKPGHPLKPYLVLYDKDIMKPTLDPCFSERLITFVCGDQKTIFKPKYTIDDQYCADCKAMREVKSFEFRGAKPEDVDYERDESIYIEMEEWDVESKTGVYNLHRTKKMPNGKHIAAVDYGAAPNYGTFTEDEIKAGQEKYADRATARYTDNKALTAFEIPDYAFKILEVIAQLKIYLQIPDVKAFMTVARGRKQAGLFKWEVIKEMKIEDLQTIETAA